MNTSFVMIVVASLVFFSSTCAAAQGKTPNFTGTWVLDTAKSKLDEHDRIESLTLTVTQTASEIRVDSALKLIPYNPAMEGGPLIRPLEQNISNTYRLDEKDREGQVPSPVGPQPATLTARREGTKLLLSQTYGDPVVILKETWTISADGRTLTSERTGAPGRTATLVFSRKP